MPAAFIPSPASSVWHLGSLPVRAFSLCMVAGVLAGLWLTDRRYRKAGGKEGVVLAVATIAVPAGIVGARIYSVVSNAHLYFGDGRDWVYVLRFWNGGLGMAGAVAAGALAAWAYCRQAGIEIGPLALAAAPALPVAQAIAVLGNWFNQSLYGRPSALPWAVAIAPVHRAVGYQVFTTFQPIFVYEALLYLLVAAAVTYGIHRFRLTGDRAFALYAGLYATARFAAEAQRVDYSPRLFGLRTNEVAMLAILLMAWSYLLLLRSRRYRGPLVRLAVAAPSRIAPALRARSDSGMADRFTQLAGRGIARTPGEAGRREPGTPGEAGRGIAGTPEEADRREPGTPGEAGRRMAGTPEEADRREAEAEAGGARETGPRPDEQGTAAGSASSAETGGPAGPGRSSGAAGSSGSGGSAGPGGSSEPGTSAAGPAKRAAGPAKPAAAPTKPAAAPTKQDRPSLAGQIPAQPTEEQLRPGPARRGSDGVPAADPMPDAQLQL
jgi:phosphatidylglycerol---prolipoprotein diacylglyceryl transferase